MKSIYISQEDYNIISEILSDLPYKVCVFGSRIKGTHQKFSDLDLCVKNQESISLDELADLKTKFSESDLPFTVDVVDYNSISDSFKKIIDDEGVSFDSVAPIGQ